MTIEIIVQSLNNKTVEAVNTTDFSKTIFESNNSTTFEYTNYILNVHSNLNSFTLNNFWINLSNIQRDIFGVIILVVSISIIYITISFIKQQSK